MSPSSPPATAAYVRNPVDALAAMAVAASEGNDLPTLLGRLAQLALGPTHADRVSFFLVDERKSALELWAVATTNDSGPDGFREGLSLPPITLDDARRARLRGSAFAIEDAGRSSLVPNEWRGAFALQSLVVAPLHFGGESLGVLIADWRDRRIIDDKVVLVVDAIATSSALAIAQAHASLALSERAAALHRLVNATRGLSSSASLSDVADAIGRAIEEVLGATHLSIHLLQDGATRQRVLLQRGLDLPEQSRVVDLPRRVVRRVVGEWLRAGAPFPVVVEDVERLADRDVRGSVDVSTAVVLPLVGREGGLVGFVVVGSRASTAPSAATLELAGALAAHVAFAVERAALVERVAIGAQFANALLELNELAPDAPDGLLAGLRHAIPSTVGFEVVGMRLATEDGIVEAGDAPCAFRELWRHWRRRRTRPEIIDHAGSVYAPVWQRGRVIGVVRAEPVNGALAAHERDLLQALANAIGDAAGRQQLRRNVERRERELALSEERARVAWDLHETVAGFLRAIETTACNLAFAQPEDVNDGVRLIAALSRSGREELETAVRMTAPLEFDERGWDEMIGTAVEALGDLLGASADLTIRGTPRSLPIEMQKLLLRVLFETLHHVQRNGRATGVAVRLEYLEATTALVVRDDGVDLGTREAMDGSPGAHFGLRVLRRRVEEVGGWVTVEQCRPRGLLVTAAVPA